VATQHVVPVSGKVTIPRQPRHAAREASHFPASLCYVGGMEEADILRSAQQLIKSYGAKAAEIAAGKVVAMQQMGDDEGMAAWLDIMLAIRSLQQENGEPPATPSQPRQK
jgi:hypothetical protein